MRRGWIPFLVVVLVILGFAVYQVWTLLELLVISGIDDAIPLSDLPAVGHEKEDVGPALIPKIIHQTYINTSIPLVWQEAQQSCIDLHPAPEWEYRLWTDADALAFVAEHYPAHLPTFEGYRFPIQRADAIRYFVLAHYGGVYLDLDDGCARDLTPLLKYPAWVRKTVPTGVSNDAMGAVPGHPFFERVIRDLPRYDRSWLLPYITVMATTGPLFLSVIWRLYSDEGLNTGDGPDGGRIRILFPQEYQRYAWSFFTHHKGDSWHAADVELIFWMARHWMLVTLLGFIIGFTVLGIGWWAYHRCISSPKPAPSGPARRQSRPGRSWFSFWRTRDAHGDYELVDRHEV